MKFESILKNIVSGLANSYGNDFFILLTKELAKAVGADYCFIAKINDEFTKSMTIATFAHGQTVDNFEYALKDTPCELVTCNKTSIFPKDVTQLFPQDILLQDMGVEAYVGASLKDMNGDIIGLVVSMFHKEIRDYDDIYTLFKLFTGRIEAEIDRSNKQKELQELSQTLEDRVQIATKRLVEQEKFASLGQLVAGVSHEINTPLGVGMTAISILKNNLDDFSKDIKDETLTQSGLDNYLVKLHETVDILDVNISRAVSLVQNFKQVAVGQSNLQISEFNVKEVILNIVKSLNPIIKTLPIQIICDIDEKLVVTSYQADYFEIFNNLIMNTLVHAFEGRESGKVIITVHREKNIIKFSIKDDGIGISEKNLSNIFDPFFTTKRGLGGTGLGLNIVYNTVVQKLKGKIDVKSNQNEGTEFFIELPA